MDVEVMGVLALSAVLLWIYIKFLFWAGRDRSSQAG